LSNDEYQRQAREQQYRDDQARFRKSQDDYARNLREQQARQSEINTKSYSRDTSRNNSIPSPFGPSVDFGSYVSGKREYEASKQPKQSFARGAAPVGRAASGVYQNGATGRNLRARALALSLGIVLVIGYYLSQDHRRSSTTPGNGADSTSYPGSAEDTRAVIPPQKESPQQEAQTLVPPDDISAPISNDNPANPPLNTDKHEQPNAKNGLTSEAESKFPTSPLESPANNVPAPTSTSIPWPSAGMEYAATHKGGAGCEGELVLAPTRIDFTCPKNAKKSFSFPVNQIQAADNDGIKLKSGDKYHFKIDGKPKQETQDIFLQWIAQARQNPNQ
jgi:hypothetical protein